MYKFIPISLRKLWNDITLREKDVIQLGIGLVNSVKNLHSTGYIHNDIKLDNIMLTESIEVVLIDYGKAEKFNLADKSHRPNKHVVQYGNPHFCSKNVHLDQTLSRRDDLIQIVYNLMCLFNSYRPLRDIIGDHPDEFIEYKKEASAEEFCKDNDCEFLSEVLDHCYSLKYDETPDYAKIIFLLKKALMDLGLGPGDIFPRNVNINNNR